MKVAIIHDWLTGMRGGELVLDSLLKIYPEAELFTLIYNKGTLNERIENRKIHTAFTDRLPFKANKYRSFLPLFPFLRNASIARSILLYGANADTIR